MADALVSINPEIKFTYRAEDYNRLKILSDHSKPTKAEIDSEIANLQAQFDSEHYKLQRQAEYPSWQTQMDMLFHAIDAGKVDKSSDFYKSLKAVKDKYPKG